jgi:hypothetical protein
MHETVETARIGAPRPDKDQNKNQMFEERLLSARNKAKCLFEAISDRGLVRPGVRESELSRDVYDLAAELYGTRKYWHKRIVRAGRNTLCPYRENPPDRVVGENDIVHFDFGPVFEEPVSGEEPISGNPAPSSLVEADFGRTYVLGDNAEHKRLAADLALVWEEVRDFFLETPDVTGRQLHGHMAVLAARKGYGLADWHCGHLIGLFPLAERIGDDRNSYICPENTTPLNALSADGEKRHWILEVHLTRQASGFGGFLEDLLWENITL